MSGPGRPPVRLHRLRTNAAEGSPHRLLVVDSEAEIEADGARELQRLRLWAAALVHRHGHEDAGQRYVWHNGETQAELADLVERTARKRETLWVVAHNLSYDLTLTRLLLHLLRSGWALTRHNLASDAPWALLKKGGRRLRLVDSWSWLPEPLATLGERVGMSKLPLPEPDDPAEAWLNRCRLDVGITVTAFESLLDSWDQHRLGWFSLTGPATAWNSMLHRQAEPGVVIDPDPEARAFERQAVVAGRREVWRLGSLPAGPYQLLDFVSAHLTVCANLPLPDRRGERFDQLALDDWRLTFPWRSVVASCRLAVKTPRYPLRVKGAILHPVGEFETVLAGPEILEARERGELRSIGPGYSYRLGTAMQPWARWALPLVTSEAGEADPMLQVFLKMASRTVPGRWGMLVSREGEQGRSWVPEWGLEPAAFGWPPKKGAILHLNGAWQALVRDQEADDAFPAVLAHIQAWVRLLLARALDRAGAGVVVQVNTDSLLLPERVVWQLGMAPFPGGAVSSFRGDPLAAGLDQLSAASTPLRLRVKDTFEAVEVVSPQHLRLNGRRTYAGIPAGARETAPNVFEFWTWPKLQGQLQRGDPAGYVREFRTVRLGHVPVSRWVAEDGCCEPPEAAWSPERGNVVLGPSPFGCGPHSAPWRQQQHPALGRWH